MKNLSRTVYFRCIVCNEDTDGGKSGFWTTDNMCVACRLLEAPNLAPYLQPETLKWANHRLEQLGHSPIVVITNEEIA